MLILIYSPRCFACREPKAPAGCAPWRGRRRRNSSCRRAGLHVIDPVGCHARVGGRTCADRAGGGQIRVALAGRPSARRRPRSTAAHADGGDLGVRVRPRRSHSARRLRARRGAHGAGHRRSRSHGLRRHQLALLARRCAARKIPARLVPERQARSRQPAQRGGWPVLVISECHAVHSFRLDDDFLLAGRLASAWGFSRPSKLGRAIAAAVTPPCRTTQ